MLVDERDPLPHGVEAHAEGGPGGATELAQPLEGSHVLGRVSVGVRLVEPAADGEHVDAQPPEQRRQHERRRAAAGVDDDLEVGLGTPDGVDAAEQLVA